MVAQQIDDPRATLSTRFQAVKRGLPLRTATTGLGRVSREDFSQRVDPAPASYLLRATSWRRPSGLRGHG